MMAIKIQCGCGQRYAFEIEPVSGETPSAVTCPACGADGTTAANAAIAQSLAAQPSPPSPDVPALHVAAPTTPAAPLPRRNLTRLPGQVDPAQAEVEARAKISWGDSPKEVTVYLMMQGFSAEDANALVQEMYAERAATIRANGISKIVIGSGLVCLPVVTLLVFLWIGVIYTYVLAATVMGGLWGAWMVVKGIFMVAAPKAESGDVAEQ